MPQLGAYSIGFSTREEDHTDRCGQEEVSFLPHIRTKVGYEYDDRCPELSLQPL